MKVRTENDNNFGHEKITILVDNMPVIKIKTSSNVSCNYIVIRSLTYIPPFPLSRATPKLQITTKNENQKNIQSYPLNPRNENKHFFVGMVDEWSILKCVSCKKATVTNNINCCTLLHIAAILSDKTTSNFKF